MRSSCHRQRPPSEKRATQIRRPAARAANHASRRPFEWSVAPVDHTGRAENVEGVRVASHMELIARRPVERAAMVRANLRVDTAVPKQRECPPRGSATAEIEVQRPVAPGTKMQAAG